MDYINPLQNYDIKTFPYDWVSFFERGRVRARFSGGCRDDAVKNLLSVNFK